MSNFYWYKKNPDLYEGELEAMERFFPQFNLQTLPNQQLSWVGEIRPLDLIWTLQLVYNHNHPSLDTYGGSIHVYSINPDLESFVRQHPNIRYNHIYTGPDGLCLCTNSTEDFQVNSTITTAATKLSWAVKWCISFELWLNGQLPEFEGHGRI